MSDGRQDELAFLAALTADPADDATRLIYADWLEEHGDPHRAEYLRLVVRATTACLERPEAARKRDVLLGSQFLITEDQHAVLEVRPLDACERRVVERPREVEADHFGEEGPAEPAHLEDFAHVA